MAMTVYQATRRAFLADVSRAASAGWLALELAWLAGLAGCAREGGHTDTRDADAFVHLTAAEARAMRAFAAQIIPSSEGSPGAEEAGAVHFVDWAFGEPSFAAQVPTVRALLADLDARARALGARSFAALGDARQAWVMRQIEGTPSFVAARTLVVIGTFADASYGGNRNGIGWALVGMDHRPSYAAPYGWYDALVGPTRPANAR